MILGYMVASHTWWGILSETPDAELRSAIDRLSGPVFFDLSHIAGFLNRYYESGGSELMSRKILELR